MHWLARLRCFTSAPPPPPARTALCSGREKAKQSSLYDKAAFFLPFLGWLRTYNVRQYLLVSLDVATTSHLAPPSPRQPLCTHNAAPSDPAWCVPAGA